MYYVSVEEVVSRLARLCRERGRVLVAVDGRGGAGKSSLARTLVEKFPMSAHIEYDWFHLPKDDVVEMRRYDHERLVSEVLGPFRAGRRLLTFHRYNWGYLAGLPEGFHETPSTIENKDILIIEGCETLHQSLVPHFDLRIWVDTSPAVSLERGMRRDIEDYKLDPEKVRAAWGEWSAWEARSLTRDDRRERADCLVSFS